EGEGLVIVVDFWKIGIGEDVRQHAPLRPDLGDYLSVLFSCPPALPALLILPVLRIADAWLGFDVIEPRVFHALAVGPHVLTGNGTGVAPDALVEVQHHADLRTNFHSAASILGATAIGSGWSAVGLSSQSTFDILRTI